jgi:peptidoglycan/xylan/chitin deacetylase (PgdA/CDA1 family)
MIWPVLVILMIMVLMLIGYRIWFSRSGLRYSLKKSNTLMIHNVAFGFDYAMSSVKRKKLVSYLDSAQKRGFMFGRMKECVDEFENDENVADRLTVSFDDGYDDTYRFFREILEPRKIPVTVFVTVGFMGKKAVWDYKPNPPAHISKEQLKQMLATGLVEIGGHSMTHAVLTRIDDNSLEHEVADCRKILEDKFSVDVRYFSYPFGRFDRRVIDAVKKAGYQAGFCGVPKELPEQDKLFAIPRIPLYLTDNLFTFNRKISHGFLSWMEFSKARMTENISDLTFEFKRKL